MKKGLIIAVMGLSLLMVSCGTTKQVTAEQAQYVESALTNREFKILVNQAYPQSGRSVNLTSPYYLEVDGDSVVSYLPYFGRAYNIPYGGGVGLNYRGPLTDYRVTAGKRDGHIVTFQGQSPDEKVEYTVEVGSSGNATVTARSQNRQLIRFTGELEKP